MKKIVPAFSLLMFLFSCGQKPADNKGTTGSDTVSVQTDNSPKETDFAIFWTAFRKAAMDNNMAELKKRTRFPLKTRGIMDDDTEVSYSADAFETLFPLFLNSPTGLNMNNFDETQLDYIKANEKIQFTDSKVPMMQNNKTASVVSMEFENTNEGWKLVLLYLDDEVSQKMGGV